MQTLHLRCSLQRCNVDASRELNLDKCVLAHSSPCYYLLIRVEDEAEPNDVWKKFDSFVSDKIKKGNPPH